MSPVRLNKYLAHTFGLSRREADERIKQGRVLINGSIASLGNVIDPSRDKVSFDNQVIASAPKRYTYLLMNKPVGYICSRKQQGDTPTIYSLLPRQYHHLKVAGRLDKDSCGLLLLTDDGDTIFKLTHPKFGKEKVYNIAINKPLSAADIKKINGGIKLEDGTSNMSVHSHKSLLPNSYSVRMSEGRNRQIRRTLKALGYTVTHLERISFGEYSLSRLNEKLYLHL